MRMSSIRGQVIAFLLFGFATGCARTARGFGGEDVHFDSGRAISGDSGPVFDLDATALDARTQPSDAELRDDPDSGALIDAGLRPRDTGPIVRDAGPSECLSGAEEECPGSALGICSTGWRFCSGGRWSVCEGVIGPELEVCDGEDNNCDGSTDEGVCGRPDTCSPARLSTSTSGTTLGGPNLYAGSCGGSAAPDMPFTWIAPASGYYTVSTDGSSYDTVLTVYEGCSSTAAELACSDDYIGTTSEVTFEASAGATYLVVVDGYYDTSAGDFVLSVWGPE